MPPATNQAAIWLAHCHHIIMSPPPLALTLALVLAVALALVLAIIWLAPCHQSGSHLTCPLLPHHYVPTTPSTSCSASISSSTSKALAVALALAIAIIWLAPCHQSGSHLTCPLPPHHYVPTTPSTSCSATLALALAVALAVALALALAIIWLASCHQSGSHLTCPLPPHHYVPTTPSTSCSASTSSSSSSSTSCSTSAGYSNHLTCPLPPIRQSFDLSTATTSLCSHHP